MRQSPHSNSQQRLALGSQLGAHSRSHPALAEGVAGGPLGVLLLPRIGHLVRPSPGPGLRRRVTWRGWELGLSGGREGHGMWSEPTHFWSTKIPTMNVKEIRSAVTHMRQYSSGGCGQMARGQPLVMAGPHRAPD